MRKLLKYIVILVVLVGLGYAIWQMLYLFVLRPELTVSGNAQAVTIYDSAGAQVKYASDAKSFRLAPGSYTVKVTVTNGGEVEHLVSLKTRQKETYSIPTGVPALNSSELITNATGWEATEQTGSLIYLATITKTLQRTDAAGNTTPLFPDTSSAGSGVDSSNSSTQISTISPLPDGQEVFATADGTPYFWDGHTVQPLSLANIDTSLLNQSQILFGSNALNTGFVMSVGQDVYYYSSAMATPNKIVHLKTRFNRLVFGGGKFLAFDTTMPYTDANLANAYSQKYLVYPALVNIASKQSTLLPEPAVDASISPDGNYLIIKYRARADAKLSRITTIMQAATNQTSLPRFSTLAPVWVSNTSFAYPANGAIWKASVSNLTPVALVDSLAGTPSSISLQPNGSLDYAVLNTSGKGLIYKITSQPQLTGNDTKKLADFLYSNQANTTAYTWSYINLGQPTFTLVLTYPPIGSNPTESDVVSSFESQLTSGRLNPQSFSITASYQPGR